jgi:hypothetical protein
MNAKNTAYLFEKYPALYRGHKWPITMNLMAFGFECGDGWFEIIDKLSSDITAIDKDVVAVQVKEKYGGLRFYTEGGTDAVFDLIDQAENLSLKTCERCGEPGTVRDEGWVYIMCDKCWNEKLAREGRP